MMHSLLLLHHALGVLRQLADWALPRTKDPGIRYALPSKNLHRSLQGLQGSRKGLVFVFIPSFCL